MQRSSGLALAVANCAVPPSQKETSQLALEDPAAASKCGGAERRWAPQPNGTIHSLIVQHTLARGICLDVHASKNPVQAHECNDPAKPPTSQRWRIDDDASAAGWSLLRWGASFDSCLDTAPPPPPPASDAEVWQKPLADGGVALLLLNRGEAAALHVTALLANVTNVGPSRTVRVRDVWARRDGPDAQGNVTRVLSPHECAVLRLTPVRREG